MSKRANKAVIIWLFAVAALVGMMVIVGGYVRLTRAGLSSSNGTPSAAWSRRSATGRGNRNLPNTSRRRNSSSSTPR